ncbi:MAG: DHH family phosphoesterase [Clostridia bacterium]|nr:DHH family phosphoesterase [Clostridia bacterium]
MNNRWVRHLNMAVINLILLVAGLTLTAYYCFSNGNISMGIIVVSLLSLCLLLNVAVLLILRRYRIKRAKSLSVYTDGVEDVPPVGTVSDLEIPMAFLTEDGTLIWANNNLREIFHDGVKLNSELRTLYNLKLKGKLDNSLLDLSDTVVFEGRSFNMLVNVARTEKSGPESFMIIVYFIEITQLLSLQKLYDEKRAAVAEIAVDSYDEIFQSSGEAVVNEISVELARIFDRWKGDSGAVIKKLVRDRYLLICDDKALESFENGKFSVLDMVKKISVGNRIQVTLSIGVGAHGENAAENYSLAASALELALSRGGDQAVVRKGGRDSYYGGSNIDVESINRVKARVMASMLRAEIEKSSIVLIMGHKNADMDSVGSALTAYRACVFAGVKAHIVLNESNPSIDVFYNKLQEHSEYDDVIIDTSYALNLIDPNMLIIVVDTSRPGLTECPKLLDYCSRVAVIDHHRRAADYIKDTVLDYTETYASSASELLIEMLRHMSPDADVPLIEAEAVYAGILVDTKNFTFKTGSRTFEVASFLRSRGVDTVSVRQYFQPDMDMYSAVSRVTSAASLKHGRVAVARCPEDVKNQKLVCAMAADRLLDISGVDASFVLSGSGDGVSVSGRSWGDINVQVILEKLGGGGHLTSAGAFLQDCSISEGEQKLLDAVDSYFKN